MIFIGVVGSGIADHASVEQSDDTGGILFCKLGVMRDHDNQLFRGDLTQNVHDLHTGFGVQRTGRLVG